MIRSIIALAICIMLGFASAKQLSHPLETTQGNSDVEVQWFENQLDHFDMQNHETFKERQILESKEWRWPNFCIPMW